jgi:hypothetical protein
MKETFNHKAESSFYLWFDNYLLDKGQAYTTETGVFYPTVDETRPGFAIYSCPYKQLVWDRGVAGATVMSGVFPMSTDIELPRGASGLKIDYMNGRVFTDIAITGELAQYVQSGYSGLNGIYVQKNSEYFVYNNGQLVEAAALPDGYYYVVNGNDKSFGTYVIPGFTGAFSRKEFNVYPTNESDYPMILERVMGNNPNLDAPATGINPYDYAAPMCLISMSSSNNTPFSFGGQDMTDLTARVLVISKDKWQMDGILSIFRDANERQIPLIPSSGIPLTFYGDLKYDYNYSDLYNQFCSNTSMYINRVVASKITERKNKNSTFFVSSLEFQLQAYRFPRLELNS